MFLCRSLDSCDAIRSDLDGKELRSITNLTAQEKDMARRITIIFKQASLAPCAVACGSPRRLLIRTSAASTSFGGRASPLSLT